VLASSWAEGNRKPPLKGGQSEVIPRLCNSIDCRIAVSKQDGRSAKRPIFFTELASAVFSAVNERCFGEKNTGNTRQGNCENSTMNELSTRFGKSGNRKDADNRCSVSKAGYRPRNAIVLVEQLIKAIPEPAILAPFVVLYRRSAMTLQKTKSGPTGRARLRMQGGRCCATHVARRLKGSHFPM